MSELSFHIAIIEDDPWYGQVLLHHLSLNPDYKASLYSCGKDFLSSLHIPFDIVCMDYGLPDYTGDKLIKMILAKKPDLSIIAISAQEEISVAVDLLKSGAKDYIIKDENAKELLWKSILMIKENLSLRKQVEDLRDQLETTFSFEKTIIGQSIAIRNTFPLVQKAARSLINVTLVGETGTGKEVYAKAIHYNSLRKKKPFVAINMAAIPNELAESELFGHEKGAFTGAVGLKKGKFEEAEGGTLFLDEIAEMDSSLQAKLLRVLQERELVRVGGTTSIPMDVRIISATNKNLLNEVQKGNFREDLYYRILGLPITLPPLRDRDNDVLVLGNYFIQEYAKQNKSKPPVLGTKAKQKLQKYPFPGNVRELKSVIDLACVLCNNDVIEAEDITFFQTSTSKFCTESEKTLKEYTCEIITAFLKKYDNNVVFVAQKLDIGKSTIYNLIKSGDIIMPTSNVAYLTN